LANNSKSNFAAVCFNGKSANPSENLLILSNFILKVYAPVWFSIKQKPSCAEGGRHLFKMLQLIQTFPASIQNIIRPVIQRNAFFAHPENLILSVLTDEDNLENQQRAVQLITTAKQQPQTDRVFKVPQLNFAAEDYTEMIT
jgi:hypothetical protein